MSDRLISDRPRRPCADPGDRPGPAPGRGAPAVLVAVLVTVLAVGLGACNHDPAPTPAGSETASATDPTIADRDRGVDPPPGDDATLVARADGELAVHAAPGDTEPNRVLPATTDFGSRLAVLVTAAGSGGDAGWYEVLVPGRPNGTTGWVRAADVTLHRVTHAVEIDLAARTLRVTDRGEEILRTPVAVGSADHPTPTGRFSLTDTLDTGDPDGPYGPFALGLSGRSEVLTEFAGGDGQIGIHGTDDPSSIGEAVSHGCVRVPDDVARTLAASLPLGTPVTIR